MAANFGPSEKRIKMMSIEMKFFRRTLVYILPTTAMKKFWKR